jgi:hypothetical protein
MELDQRRLLPAERCRTTCCQLCCQAAPEDAMVFYNRCDHGWQIACLLLPLAAILGDPEDCPWCIYSRSRGQRRRR